ncbi:MAG: tripartite tricarboxylate transporter TctB family protein [Mailhella sp.]|nr:tripartite tricarboxylate transporter TctB family protein [Mailhella sp.]
MKSVSDVVSGLLLLGFCAIGFYSVGQLDGGVSLEHVGPAGVPRAVLVLLTLLSCVLIIRGLLTKKAPHYWPERGVLLKVLAFLLLFFMYLGGIVLLNAVFMSMDDPIFEWGGAFGISTFLFLLAALPLLGRRRPVEVLLVASLTTAFMLVVFGMFFQVLLP